MSTTFSCHMSQPLTIVPALVLARASREITWHARVGRTLAGHMPTQARPWLRHCLPILYTSPFHNIPKKYQWPARSTVKSPSETLFFPRGGVVGHDVDRHIKSKAERKEWWVEGVHIGFVRNIYFSESWCFWTWCCRTKLPRIILLTFQCCIETNKCDCVEVFLVNGCLLQNYWFLLCCVPTNSFRLHLHFCIIGLWMKEYLLRPPRFSCW